MYLVGCGGVLQKLCLCLLTARGAGSERSQANTYAYIHTYIASLPYAGYCRCPHAGPVLLNTTATPNFTNLPESNCVAISKRVQCLYSLSHLQGTNSGLPVLIVYDVSLPCSPFGPILSQFSPVHIFTTFFL
jgi:hypothetical protein